MFSIICSHSKYDFGIITHFEQEIFVLMFLRLPITSVLPSLPFASSPFEFFFFIFELLIFFFIFIAPWWWFLPWLLWCTFGYHILLIVVRFVRVPCLYPFHLLLHVVHSPHQPSQLPQCLCYDLLVRFFSALCSVITVIRHG